MQNGIHDPLNSGIRGIISGQDTTGLSGLVDELDEGERGPTTQTARETSSLNPFSQSQIVVPISQKSPGSKIGAKGKVVEGV